MQSLKKIGKEIPKIESENQFLTSLKGHNSVLICRNLPICNPKTLLPNINSYTKFEEIVKKTKRWWTDGQKDSWTDTWTQIFEQRV